MVLEMYFDIFSSGLDHFSFFPAAYVGAIRAHPSLLYIWEHEPDLYDYCARSQKHRNENCLKRMRLLGLLTLKEYG